MPNSLAISASMPAQPKPGGTSAAERRFLRHIRLHTLQVLWEIEARLGYYRTKRQPRQPRPRRLVYSRLRGR